MTRKELEEAFLLLEEISVIGVPWWQRGRPVNLDDTFRRVNMKKVTTILSLRESIQRNGYHGKSGS
ncbi:MAG: hypothetical protein QMC83_03695 [Thermodesulfovibrionales bacterium]|nr:hypothetical protein [Thermodesulfovibrionales bacterium]